MFGTAPGFALGKLMEVGLMVIWAEEVKSAFTSAMTMLSPAFRGGGTPTQINTITTRDKTMQNFLFSAILRMHLFFVLFEIIRVVSLEQAMLFPSKIKQVRDEQKVNHPIPKGNSGLYSTFFSVF
jgi:hypothetical protein